MTIRLTSPIFIGGATQPVGTELTLDPAVEAGHVSSNNAVWVSQPATPDAAGQPINTFPAQAASFTLLAGMSTQRVPVTTAGITVTADNALPSGYHALIDNTSVGAITVLGASVAANKLVGVFHRGGGSWLLLGN